jgi:hypothetical protein
MGTSVTNADTFARHAVIELAARIAGIPPESLAGRMYTFLVKSFAIPHLFDRLDSQVSAKAFFLFRHLFARNHLAIGANHHHAPSRTACRPVLPTSHPILPRHRLRLGLAILQVDIIIRELVPQYRDLLIQPPVCFGMVKQIVRMMVPTAHIHRQAD